VGRSKNSKNKEKHKVGGARSGAGRGRPKKILEMEKDCK
jgi:hypothetical protein